MLSSATDPLTPSQIRSLLPSHPELARIREALLNNRSVAMADSGGWILVGAQVTVASSDADCLFEVPSAPLSRSLPQTLVTRAIECLKDAGHPLASQLIADGIGGDVDVRSLKGRLGSDSRFMRSDLDAWALTEWGLRRYTTVKELVADEVDQAGGAISLPQLEANLTRDFSVKVSTVRQVASTAPFCVSKGIVHRVGASVAKFSVPEAFQSPEDAASNVSPTFGQAPSGPPTNDELIDLMGML
ncbi:hypothetical protein [Streptodolium elevatio]